MVHEVDQKVARAHGGVANFQFQKFLGRIELLQSADPAILGQLAPGEFRMFCSEIVHAQSDQRPDRFLDDQANQIVGRVVAARSFPRKDIRADGDLAAIADDLLFEQALIDGAELLNAKIAVVDVAAAIWGLFE